ncbi:MAG: phosphoglycerate transporter [Dehalococcoidia bacterium]|nr:phosphoglycerate transporter [Dehalococcoidia bacterium]
MTYKVGWFSSGRDEAARDLLGAVWCAIENGEVPAQISFVFCSRERGEDHESDLFIEQVEEYGVPLITHSFQRFRERMGDRPLLDQDGFLPAWRAKYDTEVMERLEKHSASLCVLAGYMLIMSDEMCERYPFLNLHPSAPGGPVGAWQEVIWRLIDTRARYTGVIMHAVTPELDRGPVATYCTFPIVGGEFDPLWTGIQDSKTDELKAQSGERLPLFKLIRQHGVDRELPLIVTTLRAFAEGRVKIKGGAVLDTAGKPLQGYDLTAEIEALVGMSRSLK